MIACSPSALNPSPSTAATQDASTQILNDDDAPAMKLNSKTQKSDGLLIESSKIEKDKEDYLVGLTRQTVCSTLGDEFSPASATIGRKDTILNNIMSHELSSARAHG
ncbi:hypothetical protein ACFX2C_006892 [Malus domestica]